MLSRLLLSRTGAIALRALVELAREPGATLSVAELARRQQLPQPMLEQILLRLRRADLVQARRGRHGGYRLAHRAEAMPLARVLMAVELPRGQGAVARSGRSLDGVGIPAMPDVDCEEALPATQAVEAWSGAGSARRAVAAPRLPGVPGAQGGRPEAGPWQDDGLSTRPVRGRAAQPFAVGGAATAGWEVHGDFPHVEVDSITPDAPELPPQDPSDLGASAGHRVEQQLRRRLERLVQLELERLTLAELLYDQRSWEASLGPEGGVMLS